jgi:hypothetical protein
MRGVTSISEMVIVRMVMKIKMARGHSFVRLGGVLGDDVV